MALTRPAYSPRDARRLLLEAAADRHLTDDQLLCLLRSGPLRTAQRASTNVTAVLKQTLVRLLQSGQLTVETPGRFAPKAASATEVEAKLAAHVEQLLASDQKPTARKLRERFRVRHWQAGGWPCELTAAISETLLQFAMADRLEPPKQRRGLSLFSGGQSDQAAAAAVGLEVLHVDIQKSYELAPGNVRTVRRSTDLQGAKWGDMIAWVRLGL